MRGRGQRARDDWRRGLTDLLNAWEGLSPGDPPGPAPLPRGALQAPTGEAAAVPASLDPGSRRTYPRPQTRLEYGFSPPGGGLAWLNFLPQLGQMKTSMIFNSEFLHAPMRWLRNISFVRVFPFRRGEQLRSSVIPFRSDCHRRADPPLPSWRQDLPRMAPGLDSRRLEWPLDRRMNCRG